MRFAEIISGLVAGKRYRRPDPYYDPDDKGYFMCMGEEGFVLVYLRSPYVYHEDGYSAGAEVFEQFCLTADDLLAEDWEECP